MSSPPSYVTAAPAYYLDTIWCLAGDGGEPSADVALLAITDPREPAPTNPQGWGLFGQVSFLAGEYDERVMSLMGAREFRRSFQDYFDGDRARQIRRFIARAAEDEHIREVRLLEPESSAERSAAIGLWVARVYAAALRPDLRDLPNEMILTLLNEPETFEHKLRIAERRARLGFVDAQAPEDELTLSEWMSQYAEQWLVGTSRS